MYDIGPCLVINEFIHCSADNTVVYCAWEVRQSPLSPDHVLLAQALLSFYFYDFCSFCSILESSPLRALFFYPSYRWNYHVIALFPLSTYSISNTVDSIAKKYTSFWHFSLVKREVIELLSAPPCHPYSLHVALQAWLFLHWAWQTEQCRVSGWSQSNIVNKEAVFQKKKFHT
jgi:hypothetical protein